MEATPAFAVRAPAAAERFLFALALGFRASLRPLSLRVSLLACVVDLEIGETSRQLVSGHDADGDGKLNRKEAVKLFSDMDIGAADVTYRHVAAKARTRGASSTAQAFLAPEDLDRFFGVPDEPVLRARLRGGETAES